MSRGRKLRCGAPSRSAARAVNAGETSVNTYSAASSGSASRIAFVVPPVPAPISRIRTRRARGELPIAVMTARATSVLKVRAAGEPVYRRSVLASAAGPNSSCSGSVSPRSAEASARPQSSVTVISAAPVGNCAGDATLGPHHVCRRKRRQDHPAAVDATEHALLGQDPEQAGQEAAVLALDAERGREGRRVDALARQRRPAQVGEGAQDVLVAQRVERGQQRVVEREALARRDRAHLRLESGRDHPRATQPLRRVRRPRRGRPPLDLVGPVVGRRRPRPRQRLRPRTAEVNAFELGDDGSPRRRGPGRRP